LGVNRSGPENKKGDDTAPTKHVDETSVTRKGWPGVRVCPEGAHYEEKTWGFVFDDEREVAQGPGCHISQNAVGLNSGPPCGDVVKKERDGEEEKKGKPRQRRQYTE